MKVLWCRHFKKKCRFLLTMHIKCTIFHFLFIRTHKGSTFWTLWLCLCHTFCFVTWEVQYGSISSSVKIKVCLLLIWLTMYFILLFIAHRYFSQPNHWIDWSAGPWKWCCVLSSCEFREKSVGKTYWSGSYYCLCNPTSSRGLDRSIWWINRYITNKLFICSCFAISRFCQVL